MSIAWEDRVRNAANQQLVEWIDKSSKQMEKLWEDAKTTEDRLQLMETHGRLAERFEILSRPEADDTKRGRTKKGTELRVARRPFAG